MGTKPGEQDPACVPNAKYTLGEFSVSALTSRRETHGGSKGGREGGREGERERERERGEGEGEGEGGREGEEGREGEGEGDRDRNNRSDLISGDSTPDAGTAKRKSEET